MDDPHHHHFNHTFLTKGSQVEVTSDEDGFTGAWYVATVIHPPPVTSSPNHHTRNNLVYVEYRDLLSEDGSSGRLREYANVSYLRPSPVPDTNSPNFQLNDLVDAFYKDGWWTGVITTVVDTDKFVVSLQNPYEEVQFRSSELRIHKKWVGGRWIQPQKQDTTGWMFTVGKKVEVSFDSETLRDVWFPATVLKNSDNSSFLVEYQQPGVGVESVVHQVTVDYHHIRPSPPHLRDNNFVLLEKVDAYYDFGWWNGVITKELADNRYNVFFKHTKKEKEFIYSKVRPHLEWKGGKWFNTSQGDTVVGTTHSLKDNQIEQTPPNVGKQSPIATSTMKRRRKNQNLDSEDKSSPKDEILNDGSSKKNKLSSVGQPEGFDSEVSGVNDQTFSKTENLSHGKKVHSKRGKNTEVKTPTDSSTKKGRLTNELKNLQALETGSMFDPVKTRSQEIVEKNDATEDFLFVVLGLQCNKMELQGENVQKLPDEKTQDIAKSNEEQPPSTELNQEELEVETESVAPKRKRGRPPKSQALSPKIPVVTVNTDEIGSIDPSTLSVVETGQSKEVGLTTTSSETKSLEENHEPKDDLPKEQTGQDLLVQSGLGTKKYSTRKGKRGKRRTISINTESLAQDFQDPSKQKTNGSLEKKDSTRISEASVEVTANQSSKESEKQLQIVPCDMDSGNLPFVKTTSLWKTIESMEAFRMLPQNPHFRPLLEGVRIGAREGLAIGTMVTFSTMVDKTCSLRFDDPRSTIEDCLETLVELENNGFDVEVIRQRLTGLLLLKDKQEELKDRSKVVVEKINQHNIQEKKFDEEIEEIDRQIRELEERKKHVLLKKEKRIVKIGEIKAVNDGIEREIREIGAEFDGLAVAPFVVNSI